MEIKLLDRSKERNDLIDGIVTFYANQLKIANHKCNVSIGTATGMTKDSGMAGMVMKLEDNEYLILIDRKLPLHQMIIVLAHEMVHLKQYVRGQLRPHFNRAGKVSYTWMGRKYKNDNFESPWELEAYSRERVLANRLTRTLERKFG